jgi:alpha-tubulin suppressor-like RCC1 family protein
VLGPAAAQGVLAGGQNLSYGRKSDGTLWAWGFNNPFGQLGDGTTADRSTPVQISSLSDVVAVARGKPITTQP